MRVAIYCRVSTEDKGQDPDNQRTQLMQYVQAMGYQLVAEYLDYETGRTDARQQFRDMMADASRRKFDMVLFWSLDRFTREGVLPTLQHLQRLTGYGVGYKSFTEQYLDSCGIFKEAIIGILATIAKQESIRMSERTKLGMARAKAKGVALGRKPVLVKMHIDVNRIVQMRKEGMSWRSIGKVLRISHQSAYNIGKSCVKESPPAGPDDLTRLSA